MPAFDVELNIDLNPSYSRLFFMCATQVEEGPELTAVFWDAVGEDLKLIYVHV